MKAIYYGEILKETPIDKRSFSLYPDDEPSIGELERIVSNSKSFIIILPEHEKYEELHRSEVPYKIKNGEQLKIDNTDCTVVKVTFETRNNTLHIYTNHLIRTIPKNECEYEKLREDLVKDAAIKLNFIKMLNNQKKRKWYEFW